MTQVPSEWYTEEYYQKYNHGYGQFVESLGMLGVLSDFVSKHIFRGNRVLDIGCGRGEVVYLCEKLGAKAWGIDYAEAAIAIARKALTGYLPKKDIEERILRMDAKSLTYKAGTFDVVVMLDIVEHLYPDELEIAMKEARRVLKKGGKILIHTSPNAHNMKLIRGVAHMFGVTLVSERYHVNEQTPQNLLTVVTKYFQHASLQMVKDEKYFIHQMGERGALLKSLANLADFIYDSWLMKLVIRWDFLMNFFCTDMYVVGIK